MSTSTAQALRRHAADTRRAADRLTLLRLRLARQAAELPDGVGSRAGDLDGDLSRLTRGLRGFAAGLDAAATTRERASGRRLGGYGGAGFLGRGDAAHAQVGEVARFVGTDHGASIGGFPLEPSGVASFLPQVSHSLGEPTPPEDIDDADA